MIRVTWLKITATETKIKIERRTKLQSDIWAIDFLDAHYSSCLLWDCVLYWEPRNYYALNLRINYIKNTMKTRQFKIINTMFNK